MGWLVSNENTLFDFSKITLEYTKRFQVNDSVKEFLETNRLMELIQQSVDMEVRHRIVPVLDCSVYYIMSITCAYYRI